MTKVSFWKLLMTLDSLKEKEVISEDSYKRGLLGLTLIFDITDAKEEALEMSNQGHIGEDVLEAMLKRADEVFNTDIDIVPGPMSNDIMRIMKGAL